MDPLTLIFSSIGAATGIGIFIGVVVLVVLGLLG